MGVLFVDLSTAFHCLIREMVVGIHDPNKFQHVLAALDAAETPAERLRLGRTLPCILEELGTPAHLVRLLRSVHDSTWMTIGTNALIRTHRGTRPGFSHCGCGVPFHHVRCLQLPQALPQAEGPHGLYFPDGWHGD